TFRVQDPVSQRMLALRPDMTLQVARIAGSRLSNSPRPLRLAYSGQVVRVKGSQLRPERQFGQVGAELIGASGPTADVEVVLMAIEGLKAIGAQNLSVDLGLPTLASLVLDGIKLDSKQSSQLRTALNRKDSAAVEGMGDILSAQASAALLGMIAAVGPADKAIEKLNAIDLPAPARDLCSHLGAVISGIQVANAELQLTVDPVEIRGFEYHTGVTFALFARGASGELGRGGHYQSDGNGSAESATGFTVFMDTVLQALPAAEQMGSVYLPKGTKPDQARNLRNQGWRTISALDETSDAASEAKRLNCTHMLEGDSVRELN
ncbi:MAG: ATP phosphoribosyltransferase regulatory subunit, partial [Magnetovibrio sp.]|nr:ATP phosphoribosyltransferase regulatory subunit [Magnetovibrio sp.]